MAASGCDELGALPQYAAQPGKAAHAVLAIALGAVEATLDRHTWRNPSKTDAEYLSQLAAWGYTLSDVEQMVIDTIAQRGEHRDPDGDPISDAENFDPDEFDVG